MHRLTRLFTLMVIAKLAAATAIEQIPVVVDLAASKSLRENNLPFPAHELSPTNPTFQAEHNENLSDPAQTDNSLARPIDPWLITSPYTEQSHLTNLSTLPLPSRLLTLALTHLKPTTSSYATTPYRDALNWPTVFENLKSISASHNHTWTSTTFYVVEFRSQLKANIDRELLFHLDKESHREATESGGLLKYWYGSTGDDVDGKNLATCKWFALMFMISSNSPQIIIY